MKKFNAAMWTIYWAIFAITTVGVALYVTVDRVRTWINKHIVVPYVKGCEQIAEEIQDMYYGEED